MPCCCDARLRATILTYREVTLALVDKPGEDRFYLLCFATSIPATRLLRWWRRHWIDQVFRTLKHLLATAACNMHRENAYDEQLVLRLMASFILFYTSRVVHKARGTMDETVFNLNHY